MVHMIAGQRFETILRSVKAMSPARHGDYIIQYKLAIAGGPVLTEPLSKREAEERQVILDEALDFVANRTGKEARYEAAT